MNENLFTFIVWRDSFLVYQLKFICIMFDVLTVAASYETVYET